MQGIRRQGRSFALQLLYQIELTQQSDDETLGRVGPNEARKLVRKLRKLEVPV